MRRLALVLLAELAVATALLVPLLVSPIRRGPLLEAYLLGLGGAVLLTCVAATRRSTAADELHRSAFLRSLQRTEDEVARPADLARLEREVYLATANEQHFHQRLRPALRELAAQRLADRRALDLGSGSPEVQEALGTHGWELLRPERERATDIRAAGIPLARLESAVDALERI